MMENGSRKLAELEKRIDERFAGLEDQMTETQRQFKTMTRQVKSLRSDMRILLRFVNDLDRDCRVHRADTLIHVHR